MLPLILIYAIFCVLIYHQLKGTYKYKKKCLDDTENINSRFFLFLFLILSNFFRLLFFLYVYFFYYYDYVLVIDINNPLSNKFDLFNRFNYVDSSQLNQFSTPQFEYLDDYEGEKEEVVEKNRQWIEPIQEKWKHEYNKNEYNDIGYEDNVMEEEVPLVHNFIVDSDHKEEIASSNKSGERKLGTNQNIYSYEEQSMNENGNEDQGGSQNNNVTELLNMNFKDTKKTKEQKRDVSSTARQEGKHIKKGKEKDKNESALGIDTNGKKENDFHVKKVTYDQGGKRQTDNNSAVESDIEAEIESDIGTEIKRKEASDEESDIGTKIGSNVKSDIGSDEENDVESDKEIDVGKDIDNDIKSDNENDIDTKIEKDIRRDNENDIDTEMTSNIDTEIENDITNDEKSEEDSDMKNVTDNKKTNLNDTTEKTETVTTARTVENTENIIDLTTANVKEITKPGTDDLPVTVLTQEPSIPHRSRHRSRENINIEKNGEIKQTHIFLTTVPQKREKRKASLINTIGTFFFLGEDTKLSIKIHKSNEKNLQLWIYLFLNFLPSIFYINVYSIILFLFIKVYYIFILKTDSIFKQSIFYGNILLYLSFITITGFTFVTSIYLYKAYVLILLTLFYIILATALIYFGNKLLTQLNIRNKYYGFKKRSALTVPLRKKVIANATAEQKKTKKEKRKEGKKKQERNNGEVENITKYTHYKELKINTDSSESDYFYRRKLNFFKKNINIHSKKDLEFNIFVLVSFISFILFLNAFFNIYVAYHIIKTYMYSNYIQKIHIYLYIYLINEFIPNICIFLTYWSNNIEKKPYMANTTITNTNNMNNTIHSILNVYNIHKNSSNRFKLKSTKNKDYNTRKNKHRGSQNNSSNSISSISSSIISNSSSSSSSSSISSSTPNRNTIIDGSSNEEYIVDDIIQNKRGTIFFGKECNYSGVQLTDSNVSSCTDIYPNSTSNKIRKNMCRNL